MSIGSTGIIRNATVAPSDVEVLYFYQPTRDGVATTVSTLNSTDVISTIKDPTDVKRSLGGIYNLKLPADKFNNKGFYYVTLRPKQIYTSIMDIGVLNGFENMLGLVFDINASGVDKAKFVDGGLSGFRVEYIDANGEIMPNFFRVITSSNLCTAVGPTNAAPATYPATKYRFDPTGTLLFCTVTPSSPHSSQPSILPNIGQSGQQVIIAPTYFDPIMMEIELTEYDMDTIGIALYGDQIKRVSDGNLTFYDRNKNIYKQFNIWEYQNPANASLYQIRQRKDIVDGTMDFTGIINGNRA